MPRRKSKENLNETVYRAIREMIALNRLKPGLRLNAERLSKSWARAVHLHGKP